MSKRSKISLTDNEWRSISTNEMLNDVVINEVQNILHEQFPLAEGLERPTLGPFYNFSVSRGQFVQVLHDGALHWVCISNVGC